MRHTFRQKTISQTQSVKTGLATAHLKKIVIMQNRPIPPGSPLSTISSCDHMLIGALWLTLLQGLAGIWGPVDLFRGPPSVLNLGLGPQCRRQVPYPYTSLLPNVSMSVCEPRANNRLLEIEIPTCVGSGSIPAVDHSITGNEFLGV